MWHGLSIFWLAFAVSLDSFGVGTTYGLRKMKIPLLSTLIIGICSGIVIGASMLLGGWLTQWLSPKFANQLGAMILIGLGIWTIVNGVLHKRNEGTTHIELKKSQPPTQVWAWEFRSLGLVISVLRTPMVADVDRSGSISSMEACLLGVALSLDAFGAGLGAAFIGLSPMYVACTITVTSALFLRLGMWFGLRWGHKLWGFMLPYLPGICMILIGVVRFF
ncbi:putative sporulation protein YtaF [Hazenella coriacea]|uniref:Putative sporulation protein YtaF n=1 Tax=Hazenella coriacea TaxID=1179467 RepID=A0A4R3LBW4_9BACL|nr:putative sporulation protein YtaF [Hazenella coriacea]